MKIPIIGQRKPKTVLLALPSDGTTSVHTLHAATAPSRCYAVDAASWCTSLMCMNFNGLWALALNKGVDYFAMLHSDIAVPPGWIDMLIEELHKAKADVCSAVVPIKEEGTGRTSTVIGDPACWHTPKKVLYESDLAALPVTFTAADCGFPGYALQVNDGCWVADLRREAWRQTDADGRLSAYFHVENGIMKNAAGYWEPKVQSEDWFFATRCHELGLKVVATRRLPLMHYGRKGWPAHPPGAHAAQPPAN